MKIFSKIQYVHNLLTSKKISCRELAQKYISEIKNSKLNAYIKICEEVAMETAAIVDEKIQRNEQISLIEGVPMALKDVISTKNIETTCCSKILKGYTPIFDATAWKILKNKNSVLLGKTNMDEFAMGSTCENSCFGGAYNPHNLNHVPGGSSGGSASAVSGNLAVYALGSDTGGSVRQPAGFCGLVGIKPTYGAVSRYGLIAYASSFDQIGVFSQTTEDNAIIFDEIAKHDPKDSTSVKFNFNSLDTLKNSIKGKKIGIAREYFEDLNGEISLALENAIKIFEKMGCEVVHFKFPELKVALPIYYILACAEASSNLSRFDGVRYGYCTQNYKNIDDMICKNRSEGFGNEVKRRILLGNYVLSSGYYDAYYKKANYLRSIIKNAFNRFFEKADVMLAPVAPCAAPTFGYEFKDQVEVYMMDICTVPINTVGVPAVAIPCGFDSKNLPIGMQIIGNKFDDAKILNFAHQFELFTEFSFATDLNTGVKL